jgi:hypothetical protein
LKKRMTKLIGHLFNMSCVCRDSIPNGVSGFIILLVKGV